MSNTEPESNARRDASFLAWLDASGGSVASCPTTRTRAMMVTARRLVRAGKITMKITEYPDGYLVRFTVRAP